MLLTMALAVSFVTILELALVDRGAHWPGRASGGEAGGHVQADLSGGREGGEERLDAAVVADGPCRCREVCGERGGRGFRAGLSRLGEQSAGCGCARLRLDQRRGGRGGCLVFEFSSWWLSSTTGRIDLGLILPATTPATGRLGPAASFNPLFTHRVRITAATDLDDELRGWLATAYALAG
jgi:hypothetical protein